MTAPRLTPHQMKILRVVSRHQGPREFALAETVGSWGACGHLLRKGYITRDFFYGPRGGKHYRYSVTPLGRAALARDRARRNGVTS